MVAAPRSCRQLSPHDQIVLIGPCCAVEPSRARYDTQLRPLGIRSYLLPRERSLSDPLDAYHDEPQHRRVGGRDVDLVAGQELVEAAEHPRVAAVLAVPYDDRRTGATGAGSAAG